MRRYYVIAQKSVVTKSSHSSEWPKIIAYSYEGFFYLAEGRGYGFSANDMSRSKAKKNEWVHFFEALDATWFTEFIDKNEFADEDDFVIKVERMLGGVDIIEF